MKIRNKKNFLTSLPEGVPPPVHKQKITQWLYFAVVLFTLSCVVYLIFDYNIHYFGNGRIEVDKISISSSHGGTIKTIHVKTGQQLKSGDPIATIVKNSQCDKPISIDNSHIEKIRYDIALKESRLRLLKQDLQSINQADESFMVRRALEIGNSNQSNSASLEKDQRKLNQAIALLKSETAIQKQRLHKAKVEASSILMPDISCDHETITAPFNSRVVMLKRHSNEFTKKGDTIVILANNNSSVNINAQFESKFQRFLKRGAVLEVELADGWSTQGVITDIFSSVFDDNKQILDKDPDKFRIWAKLAPSNEASKQRWLDNDLMGVNVRGSK